MEDIIQGEVGYVSSSTAACVALRRIATRQVTDDEDDPRELIIAIHPIPFNYY